MSDMQPWGWVLFSIAVLAIVVVVVRILIIAFKKK